jgi:hypothetical protein
MGMEPADFKKALHSEMQEAALALLPRYFEMLTFSEDPEVVRKGLALMVQTVGAEAEKRQDPYGNLPVVNITFTQGSATTQTTLPAIEINAQLLPELMPTAAMQRATHVNADVDFEDDEC